MTYAVVNVHPITPDTVRVTYYNVWSDVALLTDWSNISGGWVISRSWFLTGPSLRVTTNPADPSGIPTWTLQKREPVILSAVRTYKDTLDALDAPDSVNRSSGASRDSSADELEGVRRGLLSRYALAAAVANRVGSIKLDQTLDQVATILKTQDTKPSFMAQIPAFGKLSRSQAATFNLNSVLPLSDGYIAIYSSALYPRLFVEVDIISSGPTSAAFYDLEIARRRIAQ